MTTADSTSTNLLIASAAAGDAKALELLLAGHREYLRRVVEVRLDPALRARIDASDIVQEALIAASDRIKDFLAARPTSFRIWLRRNAVERLVDARRRHLAHRRDVRRDLSITDASSQLIARGLLRNNACQAVLRQELSDCVRGAILGLSDGDQEIILLRHAEGLSNAEAAEVLDVDPRAASKRYGRALSRLLTELRKQGLKSL